MKINKSSGGVKMEAVTAKRLLIFLIVLFSMSLMVGCSHLERSPNNRPGYLAYHKPLPEAERDLNEARAAGKDKECPAEFKAASDMVDKAYAVYMACHTEEAMDIARDAIGKIKALCPAKPVVEMKPEPKPAPAPPVLEQHQERAARVIDRLTIHVNFDFDKSNVKKADDAELKQAIDFVKKYPGAKVQLEGYTDSKGTVQYNQKLSERRAEAVKQYLIKEGAVDKATISARGYGESNPVAPNKTPEGKDNPKGRAQNRRVEILIISE